MPEKNNPMLPVTNNAGSHGIRSSNGVPDNKPHPMAAEIVDVSVAKSKPAPANPPLTWSADNPY